MDLNIKIIKAVSLLFFFTYSMNIISTEKTISYKCKGLSQFELVGSSGSKEEVKIINYKFVNGILQDLNNIQCKWLNNSIKCESNFLNIRKLNINLENYNVSDYISGNKGFGVYIETFKGKCEEINWLKSLK